MIKLKTEVNRSAIKRELKAKAVERFKDSYQPELQVEAYLNGANDFFELLRLGNVSKPICPKCKGYEYSKTKKGFKCCYTDCQHEWQNV